MVLPINFWILFGICMLVSAIGFKNYVWFISLGYGFSIAAQGIAMPLLYGQNLTVGTIICCVVFTLYGLRLGGYLAIREFGKSSYKKNMVGEIKDGKTVPFGVKIAIWTSCAVLYVTQVSGVFYRLANGAADNAFVFIGAAVMIFGVSLETAADIQKNNAKKVNPRRFVDTGLYRIVRCPNYLGEILFWTGVFVSGITTYAGAGQWIVAVLAYICIVYIMFNGAQRLEKRQMARYGENEEYNAYANKTPIIIPLLPIYHLNKKK
jgi:steroid 5-alpha reductase family enzyme